MVITRHKKKINKYLRHLKSLIFYPPLFLNHFKLRDLLNKLPLHAANPKSDFPHLLSLNAYSFRILFQVIIVIRVICEICGLNRSGQFRNPANDKPKE